MMLRATTTLILFFSYEQGVTLDVMRAQRLYNDKTWPNPVVIKIENIRYQPVK